jgi:hypothetical protein
VDHSHCIHERGEHHDRGAVLVVVEHRDVQPLPQAPFDLETTGCRDVLEVDPAVHRRQRADDLDDLISVLRVQADWPRIDIGEPLEQCRLAFHHR